MNEPVPGLDACGLVSTKTGASLLNEALSDTGQDGTFHTDGTGGATPCRRSSRSASTWSVCGSAPRTTIQFDESVLSFFIDGDDAGRPTRLLRFGSRWELDRSGDDL